MVKSTRLVHPVKALSPMLSSLLPVANSIVTKSVQYANALLQITVTFLGISISVIGHKAKAPAPIVVTLPGNTILVKLVHL